MLGNATVQPSSSKLDLLQILQKIVNLKLKLLLTLLYFQLSIQIFIIIATFLLYLGPCLGPYSILGIASLSGVYIYSCCGYCGYYQVAISIAYQGIIGVGICVLDSVVAVAIGQAGGRTSRVGALVARGRVEAVAAGNNC